MARRRTGSARRKVSFEIKDFRGASNLLLDEARLAPNEARTILNLIQVQDGLWKPRWGTAYYGQDIGASPDGAVEYVKSDGSTELITVANGSAYKSTNGGNWTAISGASFTAGVTCYFMQISGFLYITNGTDPLTRYNGTSLSTYTELSAPANLAASRVASGLASGSYTYYGQATALNEVGETVGSTEASITVNKRRDNWTAGTDKVMWYWDAVAGAASYQFFLSDISGDEKLLAGTPNNFYEDDGSVQINPFTEVPDDNTTGAPMFKSMEVSGNRIWGTNIAADMYKVYWSGTGTDIGKFSAFYGGGWVNLERGGRETPTVIKHYQSGTGDGRATVFCKTPEGKGAIWQISIDTLTVGSTQFAIPTTVKIIGSYGTEAILGVVATNNDILFPNKNGINSLGPEKNFYGILRTNELTAKIRNYWRSLVGSQIEGISGYFYDAKVFFSVPTTSAGNTKTIVYDLEKRNWTVDWDVGAKQFLEYTDSTGDTHFLYVPTSGSRLVELSENIQGDLGSSFPTLYVSGRIPLQKLWKDFLKVNKVFIKLGNPRGAINFEVSGTQKNAPFKSLGSATIVPSSSSTGLGWDPLGTVQMGDTEGTPSTFSDSSDPHYIKVRKKLRDIQFTVSSNSFNTDYVLQGFIVEGNQVRVNPPSSWKLTT